MATHSLQIYNIKPEHISQEFVSYFTTIEKLIIEHPEKVSLVYRELTFFSRLKRITFQDYSDSMIAIYKLLYPHDNKTCTTGCGGTNTIDIIHARLMNQFRGFNIYNEYASIQFVNGNPQLKIEKWVSYVPDDIDPSVLVPEVDKTPTPEPEILILEQYNLIDVPPVTEPESEVTISKNSYNGKDTTTNTIPETSTDEASATGGTTTTSGGATSESTEGN